jgi:hypothetical protein
MARCPRGGGQERGLGLPLEIGHFTEWELGIAKLGLLDVENDGLATEGIDHFLFDLG